MVRLIYYYVVRWYVFSTRKINVINQTRIILWLVFKTITISLCSYSFHVAL